MVTTDGQQATRSPHKLAMAVGVFIALSIGIAGFAIVGLWGLLTDSTPHEETPTEFFAHHRADLDRVVDLARTGQIFPAAGEDYYGPLLPEDLRYLSATERVSIHPDGALFIPLWTGVPDDAGGFWYSQRTPLGRDMYGSWCEEPTDLGDGWWSCAV